MRRSTIPAIVAMLALVLATVGCSEEVGTGGPGDNGGADGWSPGGDGTSTGDTVDHPPRTEPDCSGDQCSCDGARVLCQSLCVDISSDPAHCGGCGETCDGAEVCESGQCRCPSNRERCDGDCVELSSSAEHCGECGNECGDGETCNAGSCEPLECSGAKVACEGSCIDISANPDHCGECGNECDQNETCESGNCQGLECSGSKIACDGRCVDASSNPDHCGECGIECRGSEACNSGQCVCANDSQCSQVGNDGNVVGGSCTEGGDCASDSQCLTGEEFSDGTCSVECGRGRGDCPGGTRCVDERGGICLLTCGDNSDCRDGYRCEEMEKTPGEGEVRVCISDA